MRPHLVRRPADRDRHASRRRRRRQHDLDALAARQRRRQQRRFRIDPLARGVRHQLREPPAPVEVRKRQRLAPPARARLDERLARPIDAELGDRRIRQQRPQARRSVSSSAERSARPPRDAPPRARRSRPRALQRAGSRTKLIDAPEIEIARDQHLDAIAVLLDDGRRNVDRALQHLRHDRLRARRIHDDRAAVVRRGLHRRLHGAVDHRDQNRRAEALDRNGDSPRPAVPSGRAHRCPAKQAARRRRSACAPPSTARTRAPPPAAPARASRRRAWCRARAAPPCRPR